MQTAVYMRKTGSSVTQLYRDSSDTGIELTPLPSRARDRSCISSIHQYTENTSDNVSNGSGVKHRKFINFPKLATPLVHHRDYTNRRTNKQDYL